MLGNTLPGTFPTRLSISISAVFLEVISVCHFSERVLNHHYKFTLFYTERRAFLAHLVSCQCHVRTCEVTEFPVFNLRFHALCTQCALHLNVLLALPQFNTAFQKNCLFFFFNNVVLLYF